MGNNFKVQNRYKYILEIDFALINKGDFEYALKGVAREQTELEKIHGVPVDVVLEFKNRPDTKERR